MAINAAGEIYIAGTTYSRDLPAKNQPMSSNLYRVDGNTTRPIFTLQDDVLSVEPDNQTPGRLWAGTSTGVFRSNDNGATWTAISNGLPVGSFTVAVDPKNGTTIYAAVTSQSFLYKSTDGGENWTSLVLPSPAGTILKIDPTRPSILYVSGLNNFYQGMRSQDGGLTWEHLQWHFFVTDFDARRPGVTYAINYAISGELWKSADYGITWAITSAPLGTRASKVDPFHPNTIYAVTYEAIYRSSDNGVTWTKTTAPGNFLQKIAADPRSPLLYAASTRGIVRSSDGFATWTVDSYGVSEYTSSQTNVLWPGSVPSDGGPTSVFLSAKRTSDVFVAKLDRSGNLMAAAYLGGLDDDAPVALALDASGAVYVAGTTTSAYFADVQAGGWPNYIFVSKLTGDLTRVESTLTMNGYPTGSEQLRPKSLAFDSKRGMQLGLYHSHMICHVVILDHPPQCYTLTDSSIYTVDFSGAPLQFRYAGVPSPDVLLSHLDGGLYVAGGNTIWKFRASGELEFAMGMGHATIKSGALDSNGNFVFAGTSGCGSDFYTNTDAFQPHSDAPSYTNSSHAFVAGLNPDSSAIVFSTCLRGENTDTANAVAVDAAGRPIVAGGTASHRFPTRSPLMGAFESAGGFVSMFNPGATDLLFSTFVGDLRSFEVKAITLDAAGNVVVAGHTYGGGKSNSDVVVLRLDDLQVDSTHIDSVWNAASQAAAPLAPGERVIVKTVGISSTARVLVEGVALSTSEDGTVTMPDWIDANPQASVEVEYDGGRTSPVVLPTAPHAPGLFTVDGTGVGHAIIFNEDGTPNSSENPAWHGALISIAVNGAGNQLYGVPINVHFNELSSAGVATTLDGMTVIRARVPYFNQPPYVNYKPPLIVRIVVEVGGLNSQVDATMAIKP